MGNQDDVLSSLNMAIGALNLAKAISSITPVKTVFDPAHALIAMVKVRFLLFCDEVFHVQG